MITYRRVIASRASPPLLEQRIVDARRPSKGAFMKHINMKHIWSQRETRNQALLILNTVVSLFLLCPKSKLRNQALLILNTVVSLFLLCPKSKPQKPSSFDTEHSRQSILVMSQEQTQKPSSFDTELSRQSILVMSHSQEQTSETKLFWYRTQSSVYSCSFPRAYLRN